MIYASSQSEQPLFATFLVGVAVSPIICAGFMLIFCAFIPMLSAAMHAMAKRKMTRHHDAKRKKSDACADDAIGDQKDKGTRVGHKYATIRGRRQSVIDAQAAEVREAGGEAELSDVDAALTLREATKNKKMVI
jgi:hypothetical protein